MRRADFPAGPGIDYEAEYNNRARVPEHPAIFARWTHAAEHFRASHENAELRLPYGRSARTHIDLFWPAKRDAPIVLFIHGGPILAALPSGSSADGIRYQPIHRVIKEACSIFEAAFAAHGKADPLRSAKPPMVRGGGDEESGSKSSRKKGSEVDPPLRRHDVGEPLAELAVDALLVVLPVLRLGFCSSRRSPPQPTARAAMMCDRWERPCGKFPSI